MTADRTVLSLWRGVIPWRPTMLVLAHEICEAAGVTVEDMRGAGRRRELTLPRQQFMAEARATGLFTLPQIGRFLRRDHTTVVWGIAAHKRREARRAAATQGLAA